MLFLALALASQLSVGAATEPTTTQLAATATYEFELLAAPNPGQSMGNGLDSRTGLVVGGVRDLPGSFVPTLWRDGVSVNLPIPGGATEAWAFRANQSGMVLCGAQSPTGEIAFVHVGGQNQVLPPLFGVRAWAADLNDAGIVVGGSSDAFAAHPHAAVAWLPSGVVLPLGSPATWTSIARGINASNVIVGEMRPTPSDPPQPFVWSHGVLAPLALPSSLAHGAAQDVNDRGTIVGQAFNAPATQVPIVWVSGAPFVLPLPPTASKGYAVRVNERGQILGAATLAASGELKPFLWSAGQFTFVEHLVASPAGWTYVGAFDLDDGGRIVGWGNLNGQVRGFVLTPL
ncbi:MAG: hypothetical protein HZA52_14060 [Planctomycetes bacterium]|nr:hypothetical protein [Planctomycetota bacterium]